MFIQVKNEKIELDFNFGIKCSVEGPDSYYYVQLDEYVNGDDFPTYVEGYGVSGKEKSSFYLAIEFFMDFEISVFKFVKNVGLVKIFSHRFNDYGRYVKFILDSENEKECDLWLDSIRQYEHKSGCKVILESQFEHMNQKFESFYLSKNITPYKTYRIGRFLKISNDFRTLDERCENLIWFGYWKKFWSYQHPRKWNQIDSKEIANDILGLK